MPNGVDKNYRRLLMACAAYRQSYEEWPKQARFGAGFLWNLAQLFDFENWSRLCAHLELRTMDTDDISVGGRGVVRYSEIDHSRLDETTLELAERWLDLEIRRDVEHQ